MEASQLSKALAMEDGPRVVWAANLLKETLDLRTSSPDAYLALGFLTGMAARALPPPEVRIGKRPKAKRGKR